MAAWVQVEKKYVAIIEVPGQWIIIYAVPRNAQPGMGDRPELRFKVQCLIFSRQDAPGQHQQQPGLM